MVELELLERRQRPVALLGELEPAAAVGARLAEQILLPSRIRLPQERHRDERDTGDGQEGAEDERSGHASASASARP